MAHNSSKQSKPTTKVLSKPTSKSVKPSSSKGKPAVKTAPKAKLAVKAPAKSMVKKTAPTLAKSIKSPAKAPAKKVTTPVKVSAKPAAKPVAKAPTKVIAKTAAKATAKVPPKTPPKVLTKPHITAVKPEIKLAPPAPAKRAYRKSGKKGKTSDFISGKYKPSSTLENFLTPATMFVQNGRRFGDEHRLDIKPKRADRNADGQYLSKSDINALQEILLEQRRRLLEGLGNAVNDMQDEMVAVADPNDRASQETDLALELRERDRETKLIRKIDGTLERMAQRDYGYCDACGVEIGMKRLMARPMATLCIDCKELQEFQEKQTVK